MRGHHAGGVVVVVAPADVDVQGEATDGKRRVHGIGKRVQSAALEGDLELGGLAQLQLPGPDQLVRALGQGDVGRPAVDHERAVREQDAVLLDVDRKHEDDVDGVGLRVVDGVDAAKRELESGEVDQSTLAVAHVGVERDLLAFERQGVQRVEHGAALDVAHRRCGLCDRRAPTLHDVVAQFAIGEASAIRDLQRDHDRGEQHDEQAAPEEIPAGKSEPSQLGILFHRIPP